MSVSLCPERECTGCGACLNRCPKNAIRMEPDEEGFAHPVVNADLCIGCGLCRKACPVITPVGLNMPPECAYAAWAKDEAIRCSSSSGGLFSVLAKYVLSHGGVVNGVSFEKGMELRHRVVSSVQELKAVRGSRYVQADVGLIYRHLESALKSGQLVLFTSTPCQVAGFKAYLGRDYDNLITCDLICHGVPSASFFRGCLRRQYGVDGDVSGDFRFRDLAHWGFAPAFLDTCGEVKAMCFKADFYYVAFLRGLSYRDNCYKCKYAQMQRVGDFTLGDFWGLPLGFRLQHDTRKGCSLVLLNTDKARRIYEQLEARIFSDKRAIAECKENHQLYRPVHRPACRDVFYRMWRELPAEQFAVKCRAWLRLTPVVWMCSLIPRCIRKGKSMVEQRFWTLKDRRSVRQ